MYASLLTQCTPDFSICHRCTNAVVYAAALGASESKGIVSLLEDMGYEMKPVLAVDAKATEHIFR